LRPARPTEHASFVAVRQEGLRSVLAGLLEPAARFVWEVGSGHGHFLTAYAASHPDETCVGIDIASDRIGRANRKRERARLGNLHFVRADAEDFLLVMPGRARFTSIFILFPDPWPKRRHHKNRTMKPEFLAAAAALSERGAPLYFRTDHEPYFNEVARLVREHPDWERPEKQAWPFDEPTVFQKRANLHFSLVATRR
jgi:tRNA (guanine-N7-)-methyltransferase